MSRRPDAATLLRRALERSADAREVVLAIESVRSTPWHSATFAGARHLVEAALSGENRRAWLGALPEADLPLRDHLAADLAVTACDAAAHRVRIEVLTVEER